MPLSNPKNNQSLLIAAGAVAFTSALWLVESYLQNRRDKQERQKRYETCEKIQLSSVETSYAMFQSIQGISTLTWYDGNIDQVRHAMLDKVMDICLANPWLTGRLVQTGNSSSDVSLVYSNATSERISIVSTRSFKVLSTSAGISRDTPFPELPKRLNQLECLVGPGIDLVDNDEYFFKVRLIPDCTHPTKKFALVVSLAHCVGDGHTFYQLHNMLSMKDAKVQVLDPTRKPSLTDDIATALGGKDQAASLADPPPGFIVRFLKGVILSTLFGPRTKVELFWINQDWIQNEKDQVATDQTKKEGNDTNGISYVSTNDILTARFFQLCETDQGIMSINFRGKLPGCEPNMAGNYFNYLVCRPGDCDSPAQIRSAVQEICSGTPRKPTSSPMSSWQHMASSRLFAATSNWTTFCKPVYLDNCQQDVHIPVIPCDSQSAPARFVTGLFLFRPTHDDAAGGKHKIAAMFAGPPKVLETLKQSGMVGPSVH
ncbi:unnamed protein product [Cylindrotheca closterium]|uniref:Uncharacterized protein n=1 Tax=Cylindrotheca closterium TaxID=2856 RepID=A0AAD2GB82_9STRA|nr:unnamed protein product [Cylindrotheca closterium]